MAENVTPIAASARASKNDQEKIDLSLIPVEGLEAQALAFMVGAKKYGRYNYYKGHKTSQLVAAALRHLTKFMDGEEFDPVDGQPHLGSVQACCSMIVKQKALGTLIDDRYKPAVSTGAAEAPRTMSTLTYVVMEDGKKTLL